MAMRSRWLEVRNVARADGLRPSPAAPWTPDAPSFSSIGRRRAFRAPANPAILPNAPIVYAADNAGYPYGTKSEAELAARVPALLGRLVERFHPRLAVIACNTASTIALDHVRAALDIPVVGTVPGDQAGRRTVEKPGDRRARHRSDGAPALCRRSGRALRRRLHRDPPWQRGAGRPGRSQTGGRGRLDRRHPRRDRTDDHAARRRKMDVMVLACTHFPLLAEEIAIAFPSIVQVDGGPGIARRIAYLTQGQEWPVRSSGGSGVYVRPPHFADERARSIRHRRSADTLTLLAPDTAGTVSPFVAGYFTLKSALLPSTMWSQSRSKSASRST